MDIRVIVVAGGEKYACANVYGPAPEGREELALDLDLLHPFRVGRGRPWRNRLGEHQRVRSTRARIDVKLLRDTIEIAGRGYEVLAFPLVHVRPDDVSIGAVELGVDIEHGLRVVVTRRKVIETVQRIPGNRGVDDHRRSGGEGVDVASKNRQSAIERVGLEPWLGIRVSAEYQERATGDGRGVRRRGECYREAEPGSLRVTDTERSERQEDRSDYAGSCRHSRTYEWPSDLAKCKLQNKNYRPAAVGDFTRPPSRKASGHKPVRPRAASR